MTAIDPVAMNALADRVERGERNRELDAEIAVATDLRPAWAASYPGPMWVDKREAEPVLRIVAAAGEKPHPGDPTIGNHAAYTGDLKAAVALVPAGCGVVAAWSEEGAIVQVCSMPLGAVDGQRWFPQCKAPTLVSAVAAAALRARAALVTP